MSKGIIEVGDVVQLKSGGPRMTVESIETGGSGYNCVWLSDDTKPVRGKFSCAVLDKIDKRPY